MIATGVRMLPSPENDGPFNHSHICAMKSSRFSQSARDMARPQRSACERPPARPCRELEPGEHLSVELLDEIRCQLWCDAGSNLIEDAVVRSDDVLDLAYLVVGRSSRAMMPEDVYDLSFAERVAFDGGGGMDALGEVDLVYSAGVARGHRHVGEVSALR